MTDISVRDTIRQLVLANEDDDIRAMAAVLINKEGEPELYLATNHGHSYGIIAGFEIIKYHLMRQVVEDAAKPIKDRE